MEERKVCGILKVKVPTTKLKSSSTTGKSNSTQTQMACEKNDCPFTVINTIYLYLNHSSTHVAKTVKSCKRHGKEGGGKNPLSKDKVIRKTPLRNDTDVRNIRQALLENYNVQATSRKSAQLHQKMGNFNRDA